MKLFAFLILFLSALTLHAQPCTTDSAQSMQALFPALSFETIECMEGCGGTQCARIALPDLTGRVQITGGQLGDTVRIQIWTDCNHIAFDTCIVCVADTVAADPQNTWEFTGQWSPDTFFRVCFSQQVFVGVYFKPANTGRAWAPIMQTDTLCGAVSIDYPIQANSENQAPIDIITGQSVFEMLPNRVYRVGRQLKINIK